MRLPEPSDWEFRLDLWQNPWVVSEYYDVMPWSEEHLLLLKKHLQLYADAGGKYITTYAVHSPWSDNSYSLEGSMITWIKNKDKTWTFDYSIFDKYVQLCMELGINKAITVYTPLPWGNRFYFFDEVTGNNEYAEWPPDSTVYKEVWFQFLDNLKKHLYKKGWLKITYLGINENPLENTQTVINLIKEHDTDWRITYAGNWHTELTGLLDDYSLVINSEPSQVEISQRKASGLTTTFYVCCTPDKPNNFVFSPPVESRFIGWYASAYGYDGFLRWAYDAWPSDPLRDARHTLWPAGDCFLIYPGGLSSIRFEKLREGIVDFEKIRILRQLAKKSKNKKAYLLLSELNGLMKDYIIERDNSRRNYDTPSLRNKLNSGQEIIIDLTNELE